MGLRLVLQPRPLCPALYAISVRRLGTLPAASFRFHLSVDTLAVRLTLPTTKRVVDFHHQAIAHAGRTAKGSCPNTSMTPLYCRESRGWQALWAGCRAAAPVGNPKGSARGPDAGRQRLPGIQRAAPVGRVQGGSACAGCKGKPLARSPEAERSGPVKCRVSTLCTGYYLSKQVPFGETKATPQTK